MSVSYRLAEQLGLEKKALEAEEKTSLLDPD